MRHAALNALLLAAAAALSSCSNLWYMEVQGFGAPLTLAGAEDFAELLAKEVGGPKLDFEPCVPGTQDRPTPGPCHGGRWSGGEYVRYWDERGFWTNIYATPVQGGTRLAFELAPLGLARESAEAVRRVSRVLEEGMTQRFGPGNVEVCEYPACPQD